MLADDAVNIFLYVLPKITVTKAALKGVWTDWPLPATSLTDMHWE
jgi:peptide/nickel transport system substrate-binding protein